MIMKEKNYTFKRILICGIIGLIVLIAGFFYFLCASGDAKRLDILGGYFGASIGMVVTYTAFAFTYLANERNIAEYKAETEKLRILSNKPFVALYPTAITTSITGTHIYINEQGASDQKGTQNFQKVFELVNAGNNSAVSIKLGDGLLGVVHAKSSMYINVHLPGEGFKGITELTLPIDFYDIEGLHYRQHFIVICDDEKYGEDRYSYRTTSAPEEVS